MKAEKFSISTKPYKTNRSRLITMYPTSTEYFKAVEKVSNKRFNNADVNDKSIDTPSCAITAKVHRDFGFEDTYDLIRKAYIEGFENGAIWGIDKDWEIDDIDDSDVQEHSDSNKLNKQINTYYGEYI